MFAPAQPGSNELRGSARSIPGLHVRDLLAMVDAAQPGLIARFGGHAMAAGLTLERARLPAFEAALRKLNPAAVQAYALRVRLAHLAAEPAICSARE